MNGTIQVPALGFYVVGIMLVLAGLIAVLLSYMRMRSDNERQETLNTLAATLKDGWTALGEYRTEVEQVHNAAVTKLARLADIEQELKLRAQLLNDLDESLKSLDSIIGVFSFPNHLLASVAHEKDVTGLVVTGVVMRHPDNHVNVTLIEQNQTWMTQHGREPIDLAETVEGPSHAERTEA